MLSGLEVNVITKVRPVDVRQEVEVTLFFTRDTSDLSACMPTLSLTDDHGTEKVVQGCAHW